MARIPREEAKKNVVDVLNKARSLELQAIHQYMTHHYDLEDMDYGDMAAKMKLIALDEMRHAELFANRIKELSGTPTSDIAGTIEKGQAVEAIFPHDARHEDEAISSYNDFLQVCRENGDSVTAKLFETIIDEEQIHFTYFDNVISHIEKLGQTYLAQIAGTPASTGLVIQGFVARQAAGGATQA
jgi:bacterioferritin